MLSKQPEIYLPTKDNTNYILKDKTQYDYITDVKVLNNQYVFSEEQLIELMVNVWDFSLFSHINKTTFDTGTKLIPLRNMTKDEYISELLKQ